MPPGNGAMSTSSAMRWITCPARPMATVQELRWLYDRRDLAEAQRDLAAWLTKRLEESAAFIHMLPWSIQHLRMTKEIMGEDYWPYGIDSNRHVLEVFLKYSYDQGLAAKRFEVEELFAPETHELVLI